MNHVFLTFPFNDQSTGHGALHFAERHTSSLKFLLFTWVVFILLTCILKIIWHHYLSAIFKYSLHLWEFSVQLMLSKVTGHTTLILYTTLHISGFESCSCDHQRGHPGLSLGCLRKEESDKYLFQLGIWIRLCPRPSRRLFLVCHSSCVSFSRIQTITQTVRR